MILPLDPQCDPSSDELSPNRSSVQGAHVGHYVWNQLYKGGLSLPSPLCPAGPCSAAGIRSAGSNCRGSCTAEEPTPHTPSAPKGKGLSRCCSHHGCAAIPQAQLPFIRLAAGLAVSAMGWGQCCCCCCCKGGSAVDAEQILPVGKELSVKAV